MTTMNTTVLTFPEWPMFDQREQDNLSSVLTSRNWWRMTGTAVEEFERKFAELHGVKHGLAVTNGTHAIELALMALEISAGDEVIVPAYTFISTATPVFRQGATPVAVDVDPRTLCIDPAAIEQAITEKTKAIIPVHFAGQACDMGRIMEIARTHNLRVIEDAAHAHGGAYMGKPLGSFGDIACYSFQYLKLMSCGEGGALITNDDELMDKLWLYHNVGRPKNDRSYVHSVLGSNYRISEFQAAVLLAQLERLTEQNATRFNGAQELDRLLADVSGLEPLLHRVDSTIHPYYMYMLRYDASEFGGRTREELVDHLKAAGVPAYIGYSAIHHTDVWKEHGGRAMECPVTEAAAKDMIWLHHRVMLGTLEQQEALVNFLVEVQEQWSGN